ncbi:hypothetical protein [Flavobacterium sp. HTF]|uniref:hypothetical protein n=1 Tax=Flavobacterium sp. HTF TaxID=2170732 RepID=UPI000D5F1F6E|nr:hypothetical protein [Flavobacterium sp. HTF]PWB23187.1 hypothetical protein DCO46_15275 [Flavobacterium sp. HTF]
MNKFLNYISIALLALTLFSCNKNEWTPEKEADFKAELKKGLKNTSKGVFSDDQVNYISNCVFEKIKSKNLKPNDADTPETSIMVMQMGKDCAQESFSKSKPLSAAEVNNTWNSENEKTYKNLIKEMLIKSGAKSEEASLIADCAISKLKKENIGPADLQDPKKGDLIQKIGKSCGEELMKRK